MPCLDGRSIQPGDSGGGVWADGLLVGNMWMTVTALRQQWQNLGRTVEESTDLSYAAGLNRTLVELVQTVLNAGEPPAPTKSGPW